MASNGYLLEAIWAKAWDEAPDGGTTFLEKLREYQRDALDKVSSGALTSISGAGRSSQFVSGNVPDVTPTSFLEAVGECIALYKRLAMDRDTEDEQVIYDAGLAGEFAPIIRFRADFSCSRY